MEKMIFLVDDTDSILTLASSVLDEDFRVLTMMSAEKMFSLLAKKKPDLIILDVEMPDVTGFEAAQILRENEVWQDIPIIFLTGFIDDTVLTKATNLKVLGVIDKTEITTSLLSLVHELLD